MLMFSFYYIKLLYNKMKTLIEIGAFDGSNSLKFYNNNNNNCYIYTFEPKKDLFENLVNKTSEFKNYIVMIKFLNFLMLLRLAVKCNRQKYHQILCWFLHLDLLKLQNLLLLLIALLVLHSKSLFSALLPLRF